MRARVNGSWEATVPFWPKAAIRRRADRRLRHLARIAAQHVPFYRDRLARGEMHITELRGTVDLAGWPIVPPDALRDEPERLVSEQADLAHCVRFLSSGSTGGRKSVYVDHKSLIDNAVYGTRGKWVIFKLTGALFRLRSVAIIVGDGTLDELGQMYADAFGTPRSPVQGGQLEVFSPFEEKLEVINTIKPHVVAGVAGAVADFFLEAHDRGADVHRPKLIKGTAEGISPRLRQRLENDCGILVRLSYASVESLKIGFQCEVGDGYHIHEDVCAVRIVDDDGQELPEGETGRVIVTNLVNHATVLINYDQGDRGRLSTAPCPCGRRFKRLWLEETRETPMLRTPTRQVLHYGEVLRQVIDGPGFEAMQIIVESPDRWRVLIHTEDNTHHTWHDEIAERIERMTGDEIHVELNMNTPFEYSAGGKQLPVIIRCSDQPPYLRDSEC